MRVLGVDPGTINLGYGVLDGNGGEIKVVDYGVITARARSPMADRLSFLFLKLEGIVTQYVPGAMAIEQPFVAQNVRTAIAIGQAQAIAILAAANHGIPVFEYAPAKVKHVVANYGAGSKEQIQEMVKLLLHLAEVPRPADAADALAIALCHISEIRLTNLLARRAIKENRG